jgi:hypothetical protein
MRVLGTTASVPIKLLALWAFVASALVVAQLATFVVPQLLALAAGGVADFGPMIAVVLRVIIGRGAPVSAAIMFTATLVLGLLVLPFCWLMFHQWVRPLLIAWWLPQVVIISEHTILPGGAVQATLVWNLSLLFHLDAHISVQTGTNTRLLYQLNLVAIAALITLILSALRSRRAKPGSQEQGIGDGSALGG